jgi:DNA gyrase subunit A
LIGVSLVGEMQSAYGDYAMAVLLGRAIPSLYDGLKPVTRRILTAMKNLNLRPDGRYMKSARVEGEVMGKYHPHGSSYGAMVTVAAPHSNNVPLIDGWGNWGSSVDGPAAARYTECKLTSFAWDCLLQGQDTWQTKDNYDGSLQEPVVLDSAVPYVLLNGQEGIGVGYATKVLPHNLRGIVNAIQLLPKLRTEEGLTAAAEMREELIPDFPTGCEVLRDENLEKYLSSGSGSIRCRAKVEEGVLKKAGKAKDRVTLTFTNLPPNLNPEKLGEQVKSALEKGSFDGVAEVVDESDRSGDRVVIVGKVGVKATDLLPNLFAFTDLDTRVSAKTLVIDGTKPVELSPSQVVERWFDWRMERLSVQFSYEKEKKEYRLHIVQGLLKAIDEMDLVIAAIRKAKDKAAAKTALCSDPFSYSEPQAEAILEMRLRQLTNLDKKDLISERGSLTARIKELAKLIKDPNSRETYLLKEVAEIGVRHGNARRSLVAECGLEKNSEGVVIKKAKPPAKREPQSRFIKVDEKKGVVSVVKGPRGATILEPGEKLVTVSSDAMVRKLPHAFKGPISSSGPVEVILVGKEKNVSSRNYLVVFSLGDELRSLTIDGVKLCSTTAKGKRIIPETAELLSFGENYAVSFSNTRKKDILLVAAEKGSSPGGLGKKIALLSELRN